LLRIPLQVDMIAASFLMPLWVRLIPNKLKFEDYI